MSNYVNLDHIKFLLHEVHNVDEVLKIPRYRDYDAEAIDMLLDASKDFGDKELHPYSKELDLHGVKYDNGTITAHPQVGKVMRKCGENGYICSFFDYEEGGSQSPHIANVALGYILSAADNSLMGYPGLTSGAASLIRSFGTKEQFEQFVPKMIEGKWQGTMALTESQAGSSLSDIVTSARLQEDGTYRIEGQKIFISGGDYSDAENIIHLLLARIEGAPLGIKGISLFIVPKYRIDVNGNLQGNDVLCAGEFDKLGQKGYATAHLVFGDNEDCTGYLVGDPNMGLKYMFQMMNGARLEVGMTAVSIASAAYHKSLQYAKERPQGRKLTNAGTKDPGKDQVLIIEHPDVRRMLMLQKAIVDGSASLGVTCGKYMDVSHYSTDDEERDKARDLLEILTPIIKTYPSEMGRVAVSNGLQVLGGYGFTTDFPLEQYYRDIRITALYEGTTGIQSLDLLGRKVVMKNGAAMRLLIAEIQADVQRANTYDDLAPYASILEEKLNLLQKVLGHLIGFATKGEYEKFLADATIFMEFASTIIIGWQWIQMATAAKQALVTNKTKFNVKFYENQIHIMKFFFKYEMPKTSGLSETLLNTETLTITKAEDKVFA